jgi:hypothetical protein
VVGVGGGTVSAQSVITPPTDANVDAALITPLYSARYNRYFYDRGLGKYAAVNKW